MLHFYKIKLQHINPNGIQHMVAFIALCEGFLGINPHFDLWRYFFTVNLQKKREKGSRQELHMSMGCVGIQLRNNQVGKYPSMRLSTSNKGWHSQWFYLKNDATGPLLEFTGRLIEGAQSSGGSGACWRRTRRRSETISLPSTS